MSDFLFSPTLHSASEDKGRRQRSFLPWQQTPRFRLSLMTEFFSTSPLLRNKVHWIIWLRQQPRSSKLKAPSYPDSPSFLNLCVPEQLPQLPAGTNGAAGDGPCLLCCLSPGTPWSQWQSPGPKGGWWQQIRAHRELISDLQHPCSLKCQPHAAGIPSLSASAYLGWKHSCRNKCHRSGTRTEFLVSWTLLRSVVFASHLSSGKLHLPHPDKLLFQQSCPRALCHQEVCELKSEREVRVHQLPALSTK